MGIILTVSSTSTDDPSEACDSDVTSATDAEALWAAEWDTHYTQTYYDEYNKFLEGAKQAAEEASMPEDIRKNPNLKKYWVNRYHLFSKYDDGIKLDEGMFLFRMYKYELLVFMTFVLPI